MGFRARALLEAARRVAEGKLDLEALRSLDETAARERLLALRGVGPKIANCVLLFAYGFPRAFPVDVWVQRALQTAYFRGRRRTPRQTEAFARRHFGPQAGYAQQYLFHYWRTHQRRRPKPQTPP
jgi:N-glycosylase/DNA lyase